MIAVRAMWVSLGGAVVVLVLSGCGGGSEEAANSPSGSESGTPAAGAPRNACRLITTDEVARVLGEHSSDHTTYTVTSSSGSDGSCTYAWTANGGGDEFTVNEFPASSYVAQPGVEPLEIPGIGDRAFEEVGSFYVRVGAEMVNVVNLQEGTGSDEALLAIAAGRMGG
ncbi:hypothetical protein [Nocardioides marmorisolisilvae]|uniref:DUF3558 domain-containing protein n=1 Tax=Nocardioides marmorisolisilvae TaxID=1542737 RepID=A0A3N0DXB7_9ACTN|nr:hypothetical protein [Nocardioides marmorisolisilvae]RNL80260.1 hypothetical protein EFL95_15305 [Nocardioides marmorisolisilvae]